MSHLNTALPAELESWLKDFKKQHKRPLRVLHIGNIANNAYINAKVLNRAGIDCDVICYDYYHVMGCPEWEDADFDREGIDDFRPDWKSVNLNGFVRPQWFVQGPMAQCLERLTKKRKPEKKVSLRERFYRALLRAPGVYIRLRDFSVRILHRLYGWRVRPEALKGWRFPVGRYLYGVLKYLVYTIISPIMLCLYLLAGVLAPFFLVVFLLLRKAYRVVRNLAYDPSFSGDEWNFNEQIEVLTGQFTTLYPDRPDQLTASDLGMYQGVVPVWRELLKEYDLVHAYATDGVWPLTTGVPYVAYEHGTIRNIPFEQTPQGRLCAFSYKAAHEVCITNADNIVAAGRLGLPRYGFVPHPVNEDHLNIDDKSRQLYEELHSRLNSDFIVFHPSRQHWEERRHPDWEKGNDIFIIGLARFIKEVNPRAGAVFVEWGEKVNESKSLLKELGIEDRILWVRPVPNRKMIRYIQATEMLADQFYLGAFGSTLPKALACAKPAMLYLDVSKHEWCFPEMPPVCNVKTSEEVFQDLSKIYLDKNWSDHLCKAGREWYERYHSNQVIIERLLFAYKRALEL